MLRKALPRALLRSSRAFHASPVASRVVGTNPVKAEEVQVSYPHTLPVQHLEFMTLLSPGRLESTLSSNMNMMRSLCELPLNLARSAQLVNSCETVVRAEQV